MFSTNPFAELAAAIGAEAMQVYVILMAIAVVAGVIFDVIHKKSAAYFFENAKKAEKSAKRTVSGGEKASLAVSTLTNEVLTSSELSPNPARRMSHLLTMWGFIIFVVATVALIFGSGGGIWPMLWHLGALSLAAGAGWFFFVIRVDVSSEGKKWYQLSFRGDVFIVSLLVMSAFALLWSFSGAGLSGLSLVFFVLFIAASTTLFTTVIWSKFAHMFFKPAAAYQKKITKADGSQENLPDVGEMNDPAIHARYPDIPEYMGTNPPNMGLGIKREKPTHY
jgi:hypothetical protein